MKITKILGFTNIQADVEVLYREVANDIWRIVESDPGSISSLQSNEGKSLGILATAIIDKGQLGDEEDEGEWTQSFQDNLHQALLEDQRFGKISIIVSGGPNLSHHEEWLEAGNGGAACYVLDVVIFSKNLGS